MIITSRDDLLSTFFSHSLKATEEILKITIKSRGDNKWEIKYEWIQPEKIRHRWVIEKECQRMILREEE